MKKEPKGTKQNALGRREFLRTIGAGATVPLLPPPHSRGRPEPTPRTMIRNAGRVTGRAPR